MNDQSQENGIGPTESEQQLDLLPEVSFETLPAPLLEACERAGWNDLMPVQKKALPYLIQGKDVMVQARTGSGKTGAFVLPLIHKIDPAKPHCQALILVPTRELAHQVGQEARTLAGENGLRVVEVYGGVGYKPQIDAFNEGAHLVVGTPGRILDHLEKRNLTLDKLQVLIFDEADRMLSVGFYPDMKEIQRYLPKRLFGAFMFSATYPHAVLRLAEQFQDNPKMLSLSGDQVHVANIEHVYCEVPAMGKERNLVRLIETENPTSAIIFSNTKRDVEFITQVLKNFGYDAEGLSSDLTQSKREKVLARIKSGQLRFLVATDVAARGIDIHELSHVFLMEPPEDPESYIHRAGRTGRAGASGTVYTLVDVIQKAELGRIGVKFGIDFVEKSIPTDKDVAELAETRLTALLEKKNRAVKPIERERISRYKDMAKRFGEDPDTAFLLAILLDELYQHTLHALPQQPESTPTPKPSQTEEKRKARRKKPKPKSEKSQPQPQESKIPAESRPEKPQQKPQPQKTEPKQLEKSGEQAPKQPRKQSEGQQKPAPKPAPRQAQAAPADDEPKPRPRRRRRRRPRS
ncbi:DEAD/DEAH box helicase [Pseudodesulfovibrio tunisiensis]|uniref:DEAD/DEAH box helicase n=1 Tax=Pseudodesulfovibrio tunisiensis TaxID=463192 RepID=UPI001FB33FC9|nr:DEAD/DEAH box helicase [Pseudodesulfovibrio tunisiensis]